MKFDGRKIINFIIIVDCRWGNYAPWSECTKTCGGGTRFTTRSIEREAENGGLPCVGGEVRTAVCNKDSCPSKERSDYTINQDIKDTLKLYTLNLF